MNLIDKFGHNVLAFALQSLVGATISHIRLGPNDTILVVLSYFDDSGKNTASGYLEIVDGGFHFHRITTMTSEEVKELVKNHSHEKLITQLKQTEVP